MEEVRITIRIPANIHEELKRVAEQDDRSLNAQIVRVLRQFVNDAAQSPLETPHSATSTETGKISGDK